MRPYIVAFGSVELHDHAYLKTPLAFSLLAFLETKKEADIEVAVARGVAVAQSRTQLSMV